MSHDPFNGGAWISVQSSRCAAVRYDAARQKLEIEFHVGKYRFYTYRGISPQQALGLLNASSKGKWIEAALVKTNWPFTKR